MLKNAYLVAKIATDAAENERNFANNFTKKGQLRRGVPDVKAKLKDLGSTSGSVGNWSLLQPGMRAAPPVTAAMI